MRLALVPMLVLACLVSVACEASIPEGRFACARDSDCPPEMVCRPERERCYASLRDAGADGAAEDAQP